MRARSYGLQRIRSSSCIRAGRPEPPRGLSTPAGGIWSARITLPKNVFDIKDMTCTGALADPGWITGHSYVVYGPLADGCYNYYHGEYGLTFPIPVSTGAWSRSLESRFSTLLLLPSGMFMKLGEEWPNKYNLSTLRIPRVGWESRSI